MNKKIKYCIIATVCVAALTLFISADKERNDADFKIGRNIEILLNIFRDINLFYVDKVDADKLLQDAVEGMVGQLDPYTEYLPEKEMSQFEILTTGKYGGIGSLIRQKGDYIIIAQPYKGFPADKAGLQIGDKIVEISGENAKGFDPAKVSSLLKGDPGTTVKLKIEKFYSGKVVPLNIKRERIVISGIPYFSMMNDSIGYIQHSDFSEDCSSDMRNALMSLKNSGKLKGLILDYRSNGGGILQEAVKILSLFVPKGTEVVSMRGKTKQMDATFKTETDPVDLNLPIAVLTNSASASAAEIVSGALQDLDRAVLVGQRTFGKGLVQSPRPVGYNSYLKITTAKYYIPSGRCIQAIDYAHRNEDGSVAFVPDSLVKEYATTAGRKVYDGGGIMPDVRLAPKYASRFALVVYSKGYIEDFVDIFAKQHPDGVDPKTFVLSDKDYNDFVLFMEDKNIEFQSDTKRALATLREKAQREKYIDKINEALDTIEQSLKDDKQSNLKLYKEELSEIIEDEIVMRNHYAQGVTARKIPKDKDIEAAIGILTDKARYTKIITTQNTERK